MKSYDAEFIAYPVGVEPYDPTPQDISPVPFETFTMQLAEDYSDSSTGRVSVDEEQVFLVAYTKKSGIIRQLREIETQIADTPEGTDHSDLLESKRQLVQEQHIADHAGRVLITTNLYHANRMARGSLHKTVQLASHYAELEDRMQSAATGLVRGLKTYPLRRSQHQQPFGLIDHAYHAISSEIINTKEHDTTRETLGPRPPQEVLEEISRLQRDHQIADLATIAYEGDFTAEERQEILQLHQLNVAKHHVLLDDIKFPHAAPEETWDNNDEPPILTPEEMIPDPSDSLDSFDRAVDSQIVVDFVKQALNQLEVLTKNGKTPYVEVLRLRFGIGEGAKPKTISEIAAELKLSSTRVKEIEARAKYHMKDIVMRERAADLFQSPDDGPGNTAQYSKMVVRTGRLAVRQSPLASGKKTYNFVTPKNS